MPDITAKNLEDLKCGQTISECFPGHKKEKLVSKTQLKSGKPCYDVFLLGYKEESGKMVISELSVTHNILNSFDASNSFNKLKV